MPDERSRDVEWGAVKARLDQVIHSQKNLRMVLDSVVEDYHHLREEVARLRVMLRTTLTVLAVVVAALAWIVELVMP